MKATILILFISLSAFLNAQNLISDSGFETSTELTTYSDKSIPYGAQKNVWGALQSIQNDSIKIGVRNGAAFISNNSLATPSSWINCYVYQRLPVAGLDVNKKYKISVKLKAAKPGVNAGVYFKTRAVLKMSTRNDATENVGSMKIRNVSTEWTEYSDIFLLNKTSSTFAKVAAVNVVPFTNDELKDMFIGIYIDNQKGVELMIDDVKIEPLN